MTRRTKMWLFATGVLVAYLVVAVVLGLVLKLAGRELWQMRIGLLVVGLVSAGIVLWMFRERGAPMTASGAEGEIDTAIAAARAQLTASKVTKDAHLGALPAVLMLGPEASTKTTAVVRSGLEPELLAGEAFRGETVVGTKSVNLWYARGNLLVDAGASVVADPSAWNRLMRAVRPRSLLSAITGKPQASRMAVVCFGCDEFFKPGSGESVPDAARSLRARLGEAAQQFGIRLPVYVLFTKADTIPHFDAFVRNFSAEEAREPLGAALPPDDGVAGTYAERATTRLERAFGDLYRSLAARRLPVLTREHAAEFKPGAYEFPREFRKFTPLAVDFLRELGKPSALAVSPVLRGFYFTGVQAVFVSEVTPEYSPMAQGAQQQPARASAASSATSVFSAGQVAAANAATPAAAGSPRTRKVPRWDFLPRVFPEIVLADEAAAQATRGGVRVGFFRRAGLAGAAALGLLLAILLAASYSGNRALEQNASTAVQSFAALPATPVDLPPVDALQRLDALRAELDTLSDYEHDGAPMGMRWGLYRGSALYPDVRRAWFAGFNRLLFSTTRPAMLAGLRGFPDAPTPNDDYGDSYGLLKAYLITTTHPQRSTVEFLSPVLLKRWLAGRPLDSTRTQLARRQFETYSRELAYGNPFPEAADPAAVARGRAFLRQFAGSERIYQFMLAEAAKKNPSIQFNKRYPGSAAYVAAPYEVPGAFTKSGHAFMEDAFKKVDRFLQGESWVVGEDAGQVDKAKLVAELKSRYATDYVDHWRKFLKSATVPRYASVSDAARKLTVLSGNQSPLLALFSVASQNTAIPSPDIARVFQSVQTVTPAADTVKLIGPGNQPYMAALVTLQSSVEQASKAVGPGAEAAASQAAGNAIAAKTAARQIASTFTIDQQGQTQGTVQKLMEDPIANAEVLLTRFGADQVNAQGRAFCQVARGVMNKLPFNPDGTVHASIAEVTALLRPNTGALWTLYMGALQASLQKQGTMYVQQGGNVRLSQGFIAFFNRAATLSEALFANGRQNPGLTLTLKPQLSEGTTGVVVFAEGNVIRASRNSVQTQEIEWPASANHEAKLAVQLAGATEITVLGPYSGTWGLFQLFYGADAWQPMANGTRAEWTLRSRSQGLTLPNGAPLKIGVEIIPASAAMALQRGNYAGAACPSEIAQ